ncbi:2OG-Fe(II) oxygenase [Mycolicibacterium canariasense]|uniref:2OG-Fe(II) oxygenase n=1 Tax=Mycolicibacterium canariasense TaxID=228230 RepID=A0A100WAB1_MYCCR|nr:2OG-Fe(II) oxygenase family protein [Mycolicibacterium canariasense]MCV7208873.1 isopenicillin N synthase family oxygenase [Mycolicibacterium canariasense]ORV07068.1 2OG-Fe(II) oxygenase [Mycolicibacterium canariasense]GAS94336.1 2OG-Fe(II) oxygenase [Mycolicibacterium canariasense]
MNDNTAAQISPSAEYMTTSRIAEVASSGIVDVETVDLTGSLGAGATEARLAEVADELVAAFGRTGFAVVTGHGVPQDVFDDFCATSMEFFALPVAEKMKVAFPAPEIIRGYEPLPDITGAVRAPNAMESLLINRLDAVGDYPPGSPQARLWRWPNLWPERPVNLRPVWERYYREMESLGNRLLELIAVGLGLPPDWFADKFDRHFNNLASNFYPPRHDVGDGFMIPNGTHTDHGALTLLYRPAEPGGLEVFAQDKWWNVPYIDGSLVLNVGDVLEHWTGGRLPATPHRVVWAQGPAARLGRQSVAYFQQPNPDAPLAAAPGLGGAAGPGVTAGPHISRKELGQATLDVLGV